RWCPASVGVMAERSGFPLPGLAAGGRPGAGVLDLLVGGVLVTGLEEFLAFDADVRQDPAEPAGQVPVVPAQAGHPGGHEQAADDGGVEDYRDGQADAELLDGRVA